jgi:zinc transport system substrate-binding protein
VACAALSGLPAKAQEASAPMVYATIQPLGLLAAAITEGAGLPRVMLKPGQSVHFFQLTPEHIRLLNQSTEVLWIAPELEAPIERLMATARMPYFGPMIGLADIQVIAEKPAVVAQGHSHDESVDPHIWLSPKNAAVMLKAIAARLSEKDPEFAPVYQANLVKALAQMETLEVDLAKAFDDLQDTPYLVMHPAWRYLEKAYPLFNAGTLRLDPARAPSVKQMSELKNFAQKAGVRCIIVEPSIDSRLAVRLAQMLEIKVVELDPLAGNWPLTPTGYFDWMRSLAKGWGQCK